MNQTPTVSIIIPCFQEEDFIGSCLNSILDNDYPKEKIDILVIDGMSRDQTRSIISDYRKRHPFIQLLDNLKKEQQLALNIGIQNATGEIIMRMDAHSTYKFNYISECIKALKEYQADNVGGRWITVPRNKTVVGQAICSATSVAFGVGNAYYRLVSLKPHVPALNKPKWEINVAYFCCPRTVFDQIGLFNEKLDRSEDIDFRSRLKKAGFKTLFVPTIECYYAMRTKYSAFIKHMFKNGLWVLLPLNHAPNISFSSRHVVPLLFLLSLLGSGIGSFFNPPFKWVVITILGSYSLLNFYYSFRIAWREKDIRLFFVLPWIFISLHLAYGFGSLVALFYLFSVRFSKIAVKILHRYRLININAEKTT